MNGSVGVKGALKNLELLAAKRVALNVAHGTVALLDTSDDAAWKVRIIREIPAAA